jgi:peptidoglycan L-alanyl-D-glutamate endopeptidase CwlK
MEEEKKFPKVTGLHPKVADAISAVLTEAKARGMNVGLHMGLRTIEEQDALYAKGRTIPGSIVTKAQGGFSWHNYGLAVDIVFKDSKGNWTWDDSLDWDSLGLLGKMFGLEWGGDWTAFPDLPHFQMRGKIPSVKQAREILLKEGVDKLWSLV